MRVFLLFPFLSLLLASTLAQAEYRVFKLKITKINSDKKEPAAEKIVLSTLDPIQYQGYYPVESNERIEYIETWRCFGRTDEFQDYCPNPASQKAQIPETPVSK